MKLLLKVVGESGEQSLQIRNPAATVANLRAAAAVTLKLESSAFRMNVADIALEDDSIPLAAVPEVADGATVTVTLRRPREAEPVRQAPRPQPKQSAAAADAAATLEELVQAALEAESGSEAEFDDEEGDFEGMEMELDDDDEIGSIGSGESSNIDDMSPEEQEQSRLAMMLLAMPDYATLRDRFTSDPRAVLADIQQSRPQLFALIGRHRQFFLDFVNGDAGGSGSDDDEGGAGLVACAPPQPRPSSDTNAAAVMTQEDTAAVEGLMQLGHSRERCLEAFKRARKDVNRAAELLFDPTVNWSS